TPWLKVTFSYGISQRKVTFFSAEPPLYLLGGSPAKITAGKSAPDHRGCSPPMPEPSEGHSGDLRNLRKGGKFARETISCARGDPKNKHPLLVGEGKGEVAPRGDPDLWNVGHREVDVGASSELGKRFCHSDMQSVACLPVRQGIQISGNYAGYRTEDLRYDRKMQGSSPPERNEGMLNDEYGNGKAFPHRHEVPHFSRARETIAHPRGDPNLLNVGHHEVDVGATKLGGPKDSPNMLGGSSAKQTADRCTPDLRGSSAKKTADKSPPTCGPSEGNSSDLRNLQKIATMI
ncbi:MAG: hypothetical protein V1799_13575, partial [bacterium]